MRIYTRTGDKGLTSLFGGKRVPKDHLRIQTYGTVDELNSLLGIIRSMRISRKLDSILGKIQDDLFVLGADLASPEGKKEKQLITPRIGASHVAYLEGIIDELGAKLPPLRNFIIPGGAPPAAYLHLARAVCRRAEREAVRLGRREPLGRYVLPYMNRLSDLLFVLARLANAQAEVGETLWKQSMSG